MILETTDSSHMSAKELTAYHESSLFYYKCLPFELN